MNAIEKIITQMNEQAKTEQTTVETAEKNRISKKFETDLTRLTDDFEKQKTKQLAAIDSKYRQLHNRQQVEIRQDTLNEKQQFLKKLFQRAAEEMESWSNEETRDFAGQALGMIPLQGTARFIPGGKSKTALNREWLQGKLQNLPYQLEYAEETIVGQAGFIVDDQGVQYNFIFDNLVKDIQERMAFEIADQLFG